MKIVPKPLLALLGAALIAASMPAAGGTCPPDQVGENALAGAPTMPQGVNDMELSAVDLGAEQVKLPERRLRLRHMVVLPGGIVPVHSHADRPALIMVNAGTILENSSKCKVPVRHMAGDIAREFLGTMHWWRNDGKEPVDLTIADIVNDGKTDPMKDAM